MKYEHSYSALEAEISDGPVHRLVIRNPYGEVKMTAEYGTHAEAVAAMNGFCGWKIVDEPKPDEIEECEPTGSFHGRAVEAARRLLERNGHTVLEVDWGCPRGRCDIIAYDGEAVAFIEVKANRAGSENLPCDAVRKAKREQMERIAISYLNDHFLGEAIVRFDVVSITEMSHDRCFIRHHIGAYSA